MDALEWEAFVDSWLLAVKIVAALLYGAIFTALPIWLILTAKK